MDKALTHKQKAWAEHYAGDAAGNGTRAAMLAGYSTSSDNYLNQIANKLAANPNVQDYVVQLTTENACTAAEVLHRLAQIAFMDLELLRDAKGHLDLSGPVKALELLGKYHQLFADRVDVTIAQKVLIGIDLNRFSQPQ